MANKYSDLETDAILLFEKWFQDPSLRVPEGMTWFKKGDVFAASNIKQRHYLPVMERLEWLGVIVPKGTPTELDTRFDKFEIHATVRDYANEIRAEREAEQRARQASPDLVDGFIRKARSHPKLSILIIAMIVLAFALTIVNGIFDLAKNVGGTIRREPPAVKALPDDPALPTPTSKKP